MAEPERRAASRWPAAGRPARPRHWRRAPPSTARPPSGGRWSRRSARSRRARPGRRRRGSGEAGVRGVDQVLEPEPGRPRRRRASSNPVRRRPRRGVTTAAATASSAAGQAGRQGRGDGAEPARSRGAPRRPRRMARPAAPPGRPRPTPASIRACRDGVGPRVEVAPRPARRPVHDGQIASRASGRGGRTARPRPATGTASRGAVMASEPIDSTRNRSSARPSSTMPSPPAPGAARRRASGRPRRCSDRASRSCSSSPAVASPWSGGVGQRAETTSGSAAAMASAGGDPDAGLEQRADDDRHITFRGELGDLGDRARTADPRRLDDERRRPRRPRAARARRARTRPPRRRRSGRRTRRRSSARPSISCGGSGCSTNSMSNRAIASSRSFAVARSQAPLTSSRRRTSGPMAARIARTRSTRTSVSRSAPALTLSVAKPDSTDWRAASAAAARPERRDRRVDADAIVVGLGRGVGRVEVEPGALERRVERAARARRGARGRRASAAAIGRALDGLADERRRGSSRRPRRRPARGRPRPARPGRRRRPAGGSMRRARPTSRSRSGTAGGTGSGRGRPTRPRISVMRPPPMASPTANSRP